VYKRLGGPRRLEESNTGPSSTYARYCVFLVTVVIVEFWSSLIHSQLLIAVQETPNPHENLSPKSVTIELHSYGSLPSACYEWLHVTEFQAKSSDTPDQRIYVVRVTSKDENELSVLVKFLGTKVQYHLH